MVTTTRTNKFAADCTTCDTRVPAGAGQLTKAADGWIVYCATCAALTPEARDAQVEARATDAAVTDADRAAQAQAETAYLDSRGYNLFDPDDVLYAALVEGGFAHPVSVAAPAAGRPAPAKRRTSTPRRRATTISRRRKACVTGGNCSSTTGRDCGGHDCDAN
ncbi:hypothetical protein [Rhizomonospora bruguierae]|uniref:hypothetical protein n=1 Tax=Rhizomonospora bruguierae TaxID=1581705 RepID=UPI001BD01236|nr:hypothetical protein [Micromonospora sp. NBRC 107566]